ncbi:hypothetical protein CBR_g3474 [Chara braunii]|uniref:UBX domain-containing protein n=1 Tax=Chara braunii TaxID=69332 RepID=A0A388JR22_CHABU|nr:hypothetical protein CBR_g3474 [Chara braunii]|eukprot:GBG60231.1 hypothetical protein CBR_g3474 [Chara braunii]
MRTGPAAQRAEMQSRLQQDEALRKQQEDWRLQQQDKWRQEQSGSRSSSSASTSARPQATSASVASPPPSGGGFDPFSSMAVSLSRGATPQPPVSQPTGAQTPGQKQRGEDRTTHMSTRPLPAASMDTEKTNTESQLQQSPLGNRLGELPERASGDGASQASANERSQKPASVREAGMILIAGGPSMATVETLLKLMRNILVDPSNVKFRRVRLSNPRIRETIGIAPGGLGFLEAVGFELTEEVGNDGASTKETWAVMEIDDDSAGSRLEALREAVMLLESYAQRHSQPPPGPVVSLRKEKTDEPDMQDECQPAPSETVEPCDRQVRVFLPATEGAPTKIDVPESFYNLAPAELKKEFFTRKKQLEDSQLLIPKSYREKMAAASKRQYKAAIIRIQFPDGMVLQGVFAPKERVSAIYEFTRSTLEDPSQPFNLTYSYPTKKPVIPEQGPPGQLSPTLEDAELVPAALVKYRPVSGSGEGRVYFEGLRAELISMAVPLTSTPFPETVPVDAP